jgi:5-methylcytosine-specific restriction protein B
MNYWLFNYNDSEVQISEFLTQGHVITVPVGSKSDLIKKDDKVVIWQTGKEVGCLGLGMVVSDILTNEDGRGKFVTLFINYNLQDQPISKEQLGQQVCDFEEYYKKEFVENIVEFSDDQYECLLEIIQKNQLAEDTTEQLLGSSVPVFPHNIILYGPSGTGKTYRTINYALSIIEQKPLADLAKENRRDLRERYNKYAEEGQIHFVTFHENFKYQDFIESFRKTSPSQQGISHEVEEGIFKQIALESKRSIVESLLEHMPQKESNITFNQLYSAFIDFLKGDKFESFITADGKKILLHNIARFGHLVVRPQNSFSTYTISKHKIKKLYDKFGKGIVNTENLEKQILDLIGSTNPVAVWSIFNSLKHFEGTYISELNEEGEIHEVDDAKVKEFELNKMQNIANFQAKRHVLIIDEMDRGDVISIFGETLSILNSSKREGAPEAQAVIMPYSKTYFSLPPNLYLIGTMNINDQELAELDLALRSRFHMIKVEPIPMVLPTIIAGEQEIDLAKMLLIINTRIKVLYGAGEGIGHAYLLNIQNFQELKLAFYGKIVPILNDLFKGDNAKIGLVIGKGFFHKVEFDKSKILANFDAEVNKKYGSQSRYLLKTFAEVTEDDFINIYRETLAQVATNPAQNN